MGRRGGWWSRSVCVRKVNIKIEVFLIDIIILTPDSNIRRIGYTHHFI